ncbi:hypothetical protein [Paenibacillus amylolyticus]|uniref:hypothetical protein n=1 Tax=Paenibacillus amylolyticus TaxID=1451 RepID=UPI003EB85FD0
MNIAFYPFWAARTLLSLIQVILITTLTCLIYSQTEWIGHALLFLCFYGLAHTAARFAFDFLMRRFTLSRLMIGVPLTKILLLVGIAFSLPHLTVHITLMFTGTVLFSAIIRWESLSLETLQPRLVKGEDITKANSLLSFSNYTVTGIGLIMTVITILYVGPAQAIWAAVALSLAALALIVTVLHLIHSLSNTSISLNTRRPLHK